MWAQTTAPCRKTCGTNRQASSASRHAAHQSPLSQQLASKSVTGRSRARIATERQAEGRAGTEAQGGERDLHVALGT